MNLGTIKLGQLEGAARRRQRILDFLALNLAQKWAK